MRQNGHARGSEHSSLPTADQVDEALHGGVNRDRRTRQFACEGLESGLPGACTNDRSIFQLADVRNRPLPDGRGIIKGRLL